MGPTSQTADAMSAGKAPDVAGSKLATDEAFQALAQAFEMDWNTVQTEDASETGNWPMGRTIWFALFVSAGIWAGIAGIVWLV